ncbi:organic cation transporter protein-like isoform X2 [Actinia tenebrosa]|uniref:Organic cation transporter protein-like isoform X2 n=1 Tax=Actinia tenebrosa TaxID=6105 RepID=A0A6P8HUW7_ACTTE|nr:organic cation transporter protein-like isoform X2 [Actinia tenebrosa]
MVEQAPLQASSKAAREFDEVFEHVNSFGRHQWILFVCFNLLVFPVSSQFSALVFAFSAPAFHCTTANVTCPVKKCCDKCTSYAFDGPFHSSVSEWNLICDRAFLAAIVQSSYFVGMLIGSFVTGMMSDAWGRKKCIFLCNAIMLIFGVASSFANNIILLAVLRFLVGFGLTGIMLALYIYSMELVGPSKRTAVGNLTYAFYNTFGILFVLFTYFLPDWRMLLLAITVPTVLLFPFWRMIPESPRWLIAHNQLEEAHRELMLYGGKKDKPIDPNILKTLIEDIRKDQVLKEKRTKHYTPIDLVRTPKLRKWTAIICYQWFVVAFVYFGIYLFLTQLAGNIYVNYTIMKSATLLRVPATWLIYLKFGRRISYSFLIMSVGITLLLVLAVHEVLRNTAQGTGSTSARLGGILSPYAAMMGQLPGLSIAFPVSIFGILALLAGVLMYWLPETLFSPMHQTIEAAEAAIDDYSIPCCKSPLQREEDVELAQKTGEATSHL